MNGFGRLTVAIAAALPAVPLAAQVAPGNFSNDTIGPRELRNFSLGGTPAPPPEAPPPVAAEPTPSAPPVAIEAPARRPRRPQPAAQAPAPAPLPQLAEPTPAPPVIGPPPEAAPSSPPPVAASAPPTSAGVALWPWLAAAGVLLGAVALVAFRRSRARFDRFQTEDEAAFAGVPDLPPEPIEAPPPPLSAPSPGTITARRIDPFAPGPPPPPAPAPAGIVASRLRPWLELAFQPSRAVIDEAQASVAFDIVVTNSGNAPARQVLVEAVMINAGPDQDGQLQRFFDAPAGAGEPIESIPPLGSIALSSAVSLPLDQVHAYEVGGRKLFVPVVAFNALYRWGGGEGQSSASFLLGRGGGEEGDARMAPLRLDLGPRQFRDLDARRQPLEVRR